ncbi:GlcNAc-transferase family protein [Telmatospirillum sp. J64-1]|uniref:GlcNAc-transferase family protein n=1 Tax=Telmatospirillum sp. J64-1 TaxID=2502183 RepID=UPI00115D1BF2|nr:GlcNAc-transferase family protein [Telmatospirillum sp. J64-1]
MSDTRQRTIFISIASYRDPDCQNTVRDLFRKATHPDRVFVGICWQFVPGEDDDCFVLSTRPEQVRTIEVHASQSRGACWARHRVQELWQGEDFYFQIDSHMRFVPGWDERLIAMLENCPSPKAVLSTYPLGFTPPDELAPDGLVTIHPKGFDDNGVLLQRSTLSGLDLAPERPTPSAFIGAGMVFGPGQLVREVPYDPHLYFQGEEITLAARLWTSGWDIFSPNRVVAYHDYGKRPERPRHWQDQTDWSKLNQRSEQRIRHLLGMEVSTDPAVLAELDRYGLGKQRPLSEYEAFARLDFKGRLIGGKPGLLPEQAADQPTQIARRQSVFTDIWANNGWGHPETRSGGGSSLAETQMLRAHLPNLLEFLGVKVLADAGCGDVNWMRQMTERLDLYLGFDIVPMVAEEMGKLFRDRTNCFFATRDVVMETLPKSDAILCRDCLTHLPHDAALMALKRFRQSGSRYIILTTHQTGRNYWIRSGGWYPMDLTAAPFNLPKPRLLLSEGLPRSTKALGIWLASDLPE